MATKTIHKPVLKGHGFTSCGKTHSVSQEASGHDFSRAAKAAKSTRALAHEGMLDCSKDLSEIL
jgi:hypothetical protein